MTIPEERVEYFKDGTVRAHGQLLDGLLSGYWEWFRKDGVRMRSGYFELGAQVGTWTTYDKQGAVSTPSRPTVASLPVAERSEGAAAPQGGVAGSHALGLISRAQADNFHRPSMSRVP